MFNWLFSQKTVQKEKKTQPQPQFNDYVAKEILASIKEEFGLDYRKQEYLTMRKIERFALSKNIYSFEALQKKLLENCSLKEDLINMLTVSETYFFRELGHLKIMSNFMSHSHVSRILSIPSSSGEEVYSILLYLKEYTTLKELPFVVGVDINSLVIAKAKSGCFLARSLSLLPKELQNKYFRYENNKYCILAEFFSHIKFVRENIFSKEILELGSFDIIFCRNMLIYFDESKKKKAIAQLRKMLVDNGILFLGHADIAFIPDGFEKIVTKDGSYYKKISTNT